MKPFHMSFQSCKNCLCILLVCSVMHSYGQNGPVSQRMIRQSPDSIHQNNKAEIKKLSNHAKKSLPDTLPTIKVDKSDIPELPKVDSVDMTYENGKWVLPDQMPSSMNEEELKKKAGSKLPGLPDKKIAKEDIPDYRNNLPSKNILKDTDVPTTEKKEKYVRQLEDHSDSVNQIIKKGEEITGLINQGVPDAQKIYSSKSIKKIYDSLGISKLDSMLALASSKKEVSKDDLLHAINLSFPSSPFERPMTSPKDLSDLPEVKSLTEESSIPDLSSLKMSPEELQELPPIRGFQLPTDSIPLLDSLRKLNLLKEKLNLNEREIKESVKGAMVERKPRLLDKIYFEGILSFLKDSNESNLLQISPAIGYRIKDNFSMGIGPNILINQEARKLKVATGYRAFAKYEIFSQRGYLQLEDVVDPKAVNREYINRTPHSILVGGGGLLPLSQTLAVNACVLYRINSGNYSEGKVSPWVIRIGISTRKFRKKT